MVQTKEELLKVIRGRKSVRTFDGQGLRPEDRERLEQYISGIQNPFGIPVEFVLLDAEEYGLSSPVIAGEKWYVAAKVPKVPYADVAFGYSFEQLVLYAWSLGIGTTWIGGTMNRETFENAAGLQAGEMMPCVSPLGYPAAKRSFREVLMRKGVGADTRMPASKLFFDRTWGTPLPAGKEAGMADLIEMVTWAPSAVNKQPWRIIVTDEQLLFYEKKDKGYVGEATGDLQKIDVGIALCHCVLGLEVMGRNPEISVENPGLQVPEDVDFIAAVKC